MVGDLITFTIGISLSWYYNSLPLVQTINKYLMYSMLGGAVAGGFFSGTVGTTTYRNKQGEHRPMGFFGSFILGSILGIMAPLAILCASMNLFETFCDILFSPKRAEKYIMYFPWGKNKVRGWNGKMWRTVPIEENQPWDVKWGYDNGTKRYLYDDNTVNLLKGLEKED